MPNNESDWEDVVLPQAPATQTPTDEVDWEDVVQPNAQNPAGMGVLNSSPIAFDKGAVPLVGSVDAFKQGYNDINRARKMVFGDNIVSNTIGKVQGSVGGAAMAAGTLFNPIGKLIGGIPEAVQAAAEAFNGEAGNASRTLTGQREVLPDLHAKAFNTGSQIADTALNTGSEILNEIRKDPTILSVGLGGKKGTVKQGLENVVKQGVESVKPQSGITTSNFGDSVVRNGKVLPPEKVIPRNFGPTVASAFAKDLPRGKKGVKVQDFQEAVENIGLELQRSLPEINNAADLQHAVELTRVRAGQFLNEARQQQGLPNAQTPTIITKASESMLADDALKSQFAPAEIKAALSKETVALLENFPEMTPDQLQTIATARKQLAGKTFEQMRDNKPPTLDQAVNYHIYKQVKSALDQMYAETPGAEYARKVYGGTKVVEKGIGGLVEKLAREDVTNQPNLKKNRVSPSAVLGTALTVAGEPLLGVPILTLKALNVLHNRRSAHLNHPNTKINTAFKSLRNHMEVIQSPPRPYSPQPLPPRLGQESQ